MKPIKGFKTAILTILSFVFLTLLIYLSASFSEADFNVVNWSEKNRGFYFGFTWTCWFVWTMFVLVIIITHNNTVKPENNHKINGD